MKDVHPITSALLDAMAHSTEPMVLSDPHLPDHPMIGVNAAFERLTGYSRLDIVGRNCRFLQGQSTARETAARIKSCLDAEQGCIEWIINFRRDGTMFWNLLFISPVFDDDGKLLHFFANQRDLTQGHPAGLPDYTLGRAVMPPSARTEFNTLVRMMSKEPRERTTGALEAILEAARRLNVVTTNLQAPPWSP